MKIICRDIEELGSLIRSCERVIENDECPGCILNYFCAAEVTNEDDARLVENMCRVEKYQ